MQAQVDIRGMIEETIDMHIEHKNEQLNEVCIQDSLEIENLDSYDS